MDGKLNKFFGNKHHVSDDADEIVGFRFDGVSLGKYVFEHGQTKTAQQLGLTQGAIWQMLRDGRHVYITEQSNGKLLAFELKIIGRD